MNKWIYILGALLIAGFAVLTLIELQNAGTPYVTTVAQARTIKDKPMQFIGSIVKGKTSYDSSADRLTFSLKDSKGRTLRVRYEGIKPGNFDTADKAVVRGVFRGTEFDADQVLTKCPSKYQDK